MTTRNRPMPNPALWSKTFRNDLRNSQRSEKILAAIDFLTKVLAIATDAMNVLGRRRCSRPASPDSDLSR